MPFVRFLLNATCMSCMLVAGGLTTEAHAQQIYRTVGPDGRVTFSDKPPLDAAAAALATTVATASGAAVANTASMPFELKQAANRYPVTLYSGVNCEPCLAGRTFLSGRGIPFTEKTVSSNEDIEALQRLTGGNTVPMLSIGGQQLKGFSDAEWTQFLDVAGYPKTSQLPAGYRQQPVTPLVVAQRPSPLRAQAPSEAAPPVPPPAPTLPEPAENNPRGIRF